MQIYLYIYVNHELIYRDHQISVFSFSNLLLVLQNIAMAPKLCFYLFISHFILSHCRLDSHTWERVAHEITSVFHLICILSRLSSPSIFLLLFYMPSFYFFYEFCCWESEASVVFLSMIFCFFAVFHVTDASGNKVTTQDTLDFVEKVLLLKSLSC